MPILEVAEGLAHYGALGLVCFLMVIVWFKKDKEAKAAVEKQVQMAEDHKNEMVLSERAHAQSMMEMARHYDETLSEVNQTLERLTESMEEE